MTNPAHGFYFLSPRGTSGERTEERGNPTQALLLSPTLSAIRWRRGSRFDRGSAALCHPWFNSPLRTRPFAILILLFVLLVPLGGNFVFAADKSGVSPNTVSLPKGPGSIEGLGDAFQPMLNTGMAKYGIKLSVPPGPAGGAPGLALAYEGGGGNGPLGFGWDFSTPYIQRQTDKGMPRYVDGANNLDDNHDGQVDDPDEVDRIINDAKEELVPQASGDWFCENEGAFIRYRRNGVAWVGTLPDGTRMDFGLTSSGRVEDTATGRVFKWLLEETTDTSGNVILYSYTNFPDATNLNQKYLAGIAYGPGAPALSGPPWPNFHFVTFTYEDRPDWFEDGRAGFLVRTGKRLKEVIVGTQGPTLAGHLAGDFNGDTVTDNLVRKYPLTYLDYAPGHSHWSLLQSIGRVGANGTSNLPPVTFGYSVCNPPDTVSAAGQEIDGTNEPPYVMDNELVDLVDLNADGLPDILKTDYSGGQHTAFINEGEVLADGNRAIRWRSATEVGGEQLAWNINLKSPDKVAHLADMDGDGLADLVYKTPSDEVYYFANEGKTSWGARQAMTVLDMSPPSPFGTPNVKTADIDFDKRIDIIQSISVGDGTDYRIWFNLGNQRFSAPVTVSQNSGFMLSQKGVHIADFNGDRVPDIAWIRPTAVIVTAGLGYGNFAEPVTVDIPDVMLDDLLLDRAVLQDITGDGLADLIIERPEPGVLWYWVNLGNYTFSNRKIITGMPTGIGQKPTIRWADLNGNGTTDLIYSDSFSTPRIRTVDVGEVIGCVPRPNTLTSVANGIGRVTQIGYEFSTKFALQDAAAGKPWTDPMPFPVQVVASVTNLDSLGHAYVSTFRYHNGYYDPVEKQFRGFAHVEQTDLGDASAPTLVTRSYFDTGRQFEAMKGKVLRLTAAQENGAVFSDEAASWINPPVTLMTGVNGQAVRFAHPVGKTNTILELGVGTARRLESEFAYDQYGNQTRDAEYGIVENGDRSAFDDERIITTEYATNLPAWIIHLPKRAVVQDEHDFVISKTELFYDDETFSGANFGEITRGIGNLTMKREWKTPADPNAFINTVRTKYDTYGNTKSLLDPLAVAPGGTLDPNGGHARVIAYDARFHTYPISETIHIGHGSAALSYLASYDEGFGTVSSANDFNSNSTTFGYDAFGRLINIIRPGDSPDYPTAEYSYALAVPFPLPPGGEGQGEGVVNYVESRQLDKTPGTAGDHRNHYLIGRQFVDGLGRKLLSKQEAAPAAPGGPPRVSVKEAAIFNARQKPSWVLNPFYTQLSGDLDTQLAFESIESADWTGSFQFNDTLTPLTLANAHGKSIGYDAALRPLNTTNQDGTFSHTAYEPLLTKSYDENDNDPNSPHSNTPILHYQDGLGRLVRVDEMAKLNDDGTPGPLNTWTTRYEYDLNDQLTKITDSQNNVKVLRYDGLKRKTFMNDPDRGATRDVYDDASNEVETTDAKDQRITYTYDGANRILTEDYHDEGQPFSANRTYAPSLPISPLNLPDVAYFYDVAQQDLDMGDGTTATAANVRGKLAYVWDLSGEEHTSYDARERATNTVKRVRDPIHGQLVSFRTAFAYDSADRVTKLIYPDNDQIGYQYDNQSLVAQITGGPTGNIISSLAYWPSGQQREIVYGNGVHTTYTHDSRLRLKELSTLNSQLSTEFIHFAYQFDNASNIKSIEDRRPTLTVPSDDKRRNTQAFTYDSLNRLTSVSYNSPSPATVNGGSIQYRYDRIGNMLEQSSSIVHEEKGLPVANLGEMDSGGTLGRIGRIGRSPTDPPGPHALTTIRNSSFPIRNYPYDANGNMTNLDGLTATWDFKDRLVALDNAEMHADYTYDFTDRRITKKVTSKSSSTLNPQPSTVVYVGKHFEVREFEAPTKYVFNGATRVARVTGTLSSNDRVQRIRISTGWNLISLAVTAANALHQLNSLSASGGEGQGEVVSAFRWDKSLQTWLLVATSDLLPAGTILWVDAVTNATASVTGTYPGPLRDVLIAPIGGNFLPGYGLEVLPFTNQPQAITASRFAADQWQSQLPSELNSLSDFPPVLASGEAFFAQASVPIVLVLPDPALGLRFYHQDHLGSSSCLTDGDGKLIEEAAFYPFGAPRHEDCPRGPRDTYQFTQKERDFESSLSYFEARFQSGVLDRFITVDPLCYSISASILVWPQRLHCYSYSGNNPLKFIDPTGLGREPIFRELEVSGDFKLSFGKEEEFGKKGDETYGKIFGYVYGEVFGTYNMTSGNAKAGFQFGLLGGYELESPIFDSKASWNPHFGAEFGQNLTADSKTQVAIRKYGLGGKLEYTEHAEVLFSGEIEPKGKIGIGGWKLSGKGELEISKETRMVNGRSETFLTIHGEGTAKLKGKWGVFDVKLELKGKVDAVINLSELEREVNTSNKKSDVQIDKDMYFLNAGPKW